jgi:hypothetical protein
MQRSASGPIWLAISRRVAGVELAVGGDTHAADRDVDDLALECELDIRADSSPSSETDSSVITRLPPDMLQPRRSVGGAGSTLRAIWS